MTTNWDWHFKSQTVADICGFQGSFVSRFFTGFTMSDIEGKKRQEDKRLFLFWKTQSCKVFEMYPAVEGMLNCQADFVLRYKSWQRLLFQWLKPFVWKSNTYCMFLLHFNAASFFFFFQKTLGEKRIWVFLDYVGILYGWMQGLIFYFLCCLH